MNSVIKIFAGLSIITLCGCMTYHSPNRTQWPLYLRGASFTDMTEPARIAKRPVYLGSGGKLISNETLPNSAEYGDKVANDNAAAPLGRGGSLFSCGYSARYISNTVRGSVQNLSTPSQ